MKLVQSNYNLLKGFKKLFFLDPYAICYIFSVLFLYNFHIVFPQILCFLFLFLHLSGLIIFKNQKSYLI